MTLFRVLSVRLWVRVNPLTDNVVSLNLTTGSEEDAANELVHAIKAAVNRFLTEKDIPVAELALLIDPAWFIILMEHKKLMNVRYSRDTVDGRSNQPSG
nr:hypothetical protein [Enterobacter cloacae]